jgi:LPS export ABC transporter permease LptG
MRLSDRYVFSELLVPFFIGTLAVLMMLVGNTLFAILEPMLRDKWPVAAVARMLILNIPTVLVLTLPVATALAASLAVSRMARDGEIVALRSAGTSLFRTFLPILIFGVGTAAANLYISDRVVPWAWREQQNVQAILDSLPTNPVETGLTVRADNYTITFESAQKVSPTRRRLNRVILVENPLPGSVDFPNMTFAESADYENGAWYLRNVAYHRFARDGATQFDVVAKEGTLNLKIDFSGMYQPPQGQYDKYSFEDLTKRATDARRFGSLVEARTYETERWFKLSLPLMSIVFALFAAPLSLRFARTGAFTGVLLSIITVVIGWNGLLFMKSLAYGGTLPPPIAAFIPNVVFAGMGFWLLRQQE